MARATLAKLLLLVLLVVIICLPEFFTLYRVLKVNLTCLPYRPHGGGMEAAVGSGRKDPSLILDEEWKVCTAMDPERATGDGDQELSWFRCETDTNLKALCTDSSASALVQVSMELQLRDAEALNVTLWGLRNCNSLHLHPPEEEEAGAETKAFYCCYPRAMSSESVPRDLCLLQLFNQTALRQVAGNQLLLVEKDEWRCIFRALWLVLLCVVLLIIFTYLFRQICLCKKPKISRADQNFTGNLNGTPHQREETLFWTEMPPIHEVPSEDEIETLLDGNNEQSFTANLHHRCNHTMLPPAADRPCDRQTFHST